MKIQDLTQYLETIAPSHYQESYDNSGLIVGDPQAAITGVMVCLDSTEAVVEEAIAKGCNVVVAHHPIVFRGLKRLNGSNYIERTVIKAIKNDVAIYAIHTNLDNVYFNGVNTKISEKLGLQNTQILSPKRPDNPQVGSGMIGELATPMSELNFLKFVKDTMQAGCVRHTNLLNKPVKKVAVCGGAGGFLLKQAIRQGADAFVTADYKYHEFFDADGQLIIADIGHYESEQYTIDLLQQLISEKFRTFAAYLTTVNTNPVNYI